MPPATSTAAVPAPALNPLLADSTLPLFPDIRPEHIEPALAEVLAACRSRLAEIARLAEPTFASVVVPLEELKHRLARTWSPIGHLNGVMNSEALRAAYNACLPLLSEYYTDLSQSEPLYRSYLHIRNREGARLDAVQLAVLERALHDFRQAGVALDGERKLRFKSIMSEVAQLAGVNAGIVAQAAQRARDAGVDGWIFGLDQPTYVAVVTDADSAALRRVFYEAWSTRASDQGPGAGRFDNTAVMEGILRLRHEAARLLDYPSYAQYALADRMASGVPEVTSFLMRLAGAAREQAKAELAELEAYAGRPLEAWDLSYYS